MIYWHTLLLAMMGIVMVAVLGCSARKVAPIEERGEPPATYRVVRGDTLIGISWRYGLNYREVAAWNRLKSPDRIYAGQELRLRPPMGTPSAVASSTPPPSQSGTPSSASKAAPPAPETGGEGVGTRSNASERVIGHVAWRWPIEGQVERGYKPDTPGRKGIQIGGKLGQPVHAASPGEVVYSGSGLPGYGRLIIVKHSDDFLSAYGYLGKIFVKEGDNVKMGQTIAELGSSNENRPALHFEIRQEGKPVNPLRFLPS